MFLHIGEFGIFPHEIKLAFFLRSRRKEILAKRLLNSVSKIPSNLVQIGWLKMLGLPSPVK